MAEAVKGQILVFLPLGQQARLATDATWQAAAQQLMTVEQSRPKGGYHAATSEGAS